MARQSVERIGTVLDLYRIDVGDYPTTEQGLGALVAAPAGVAGWNGPYLRGGEAVPLDPWNRPYRYRAPSARAGRDYDLCSAGPGGQAGEPGQEGSVCNR